MNDLSNPNKLALKDMPEEQAVELATHFAKGGRVERFRRNEDTWVLTNAIARLNTYRLAPTPAHIPWGAITDKYNYAAMDKEGKWHVYDCPPDCRPSSNMWLSDGDFSSLDAFSGLRPGTGIDWLESLQVRPGYKEDTQ